MSSTADRRASAVRWTGFETIKGRHITPIRIRRPDKPAHRQQSIEIKGVNTSSVRNPKACYNGQATGAPHFMRISLTTVRPRRSRAASSGQSIECSPTKQTEQRMKKTKAMPRRVKVYTWKAPSLTVKSARRSWGPPIQGAASSNPAGHAY